jgi:beta-glucosidase
VVDVQGGFDVARRTEEQSAVLLKNAGALPLARTLRTVAVIGPHADTGMISGGGSAQVDPPGEVTGRGWRGVVWYPSSPLNAIKAKMPGARVNFASGANIAEAVALAKSADVAIVFAYQWEAEDKDLANLSLPEKQDELIAAVTAANPHTVVVLETGGPILMPWLGGASAVLEAWYGGAKGADAVANILFGDVNPSGKLPVTFPLHEADLPRPVVAKPAEGAPQNVLSFSVDYNIEGQNVGYKWFESQSKPVLFPFGFGLSYTTFRYSALQPAADLSSVSVTVTNTGKRTGSDVVEVYATVPSPGEAKRLIGWQKMELAPGESRVAHIAVDSRLLSIWDGKWVRPAGTFNVMAGGSSAELPLKAVVTLK